jgi:hypothetical protein
VPDLPVDVLAADRPRAPGAARDLIAAGQPTMTSLSSTSCTPGAVHAASMAVFRSIHGPELRIVASVLGEETYLELVVDATLARGARSRLTCRAAAPDRAAHRHDGVPH